MLEARGGAGPQTWLVLLLGALTLGIHPRESMQEQQQGTIAHTWVPLSSGGCTVGTAAKAL